MTLGERLKQARLSAGLSQRQLCGKDLTRNMLSQIENGKALPSLDTLMLLASRLHLPVSHFLGEPVSQNGGKMAQARRLYAAGQPRQALDALSDYKSPDELLDNEYRLLRKLCYQALAAEAIRQQRYPYARELLKTAGELPSFYPVEGLPLLAAMAGVDDPLPSLDETLCVYAELALRTGDPQRAQALLAAAETRDARWYTRMGRSLFAQNAYEEAAAMLQKGEQTKEIYGILEICYRELGDFAKAYDYACRQR